MVALRKRNTSAKKMILDILRASGSALSQQAIEQEVKGAMDRVTVYRVLNGFCEDGYIHKVMSDDGKYYFAMCRSCEEKNHRHDHFHFRCLSCHKVECMKEEVHIKIPKGYRLENINCLISGYCSACS